MIEQVGTTEWQAANKVRAALYRWFADIFAIELTSTTIANWQNHDDDGYASLHNIFSSLGLEPQSARVQAAISTLNNLPVSDSRLELAADFAQIFLISGADSAPPYASFYLDDDNQLYAKPDQQMREFLASRKLRLHSDFREPNDHISVYLHVMHLWIISSIENKQDIITQNINIKDISTTAEEQLDFLDNALLNWLPLFAARCQKIDVKSDFYPALSNLLEAFVREDRAALADLLSVTPS